MTRRLPVLVEATLGRVQAERIKRGQEIQAAVRQDGVVTCRRGCSSCCTYPVHLSLAEGILVYRGLAERGRMTPAFRASLEAHWRQVALLALPVWFLAGIACPLLREGECTAYEARPLLCRATFSRSRPELCRAGSLGGELPLVPVGAAVGAAVSDWVAVMQRQHRVRVGQVPLSLAILLGEKLTTGELNLDTVDAYVVAAYKELS